MSDARNAIRCAIYTRKSTDEGLEQSFNSLEAQREACAAYVQSQRHERWREIETHYDDGGFSGGTMDRPALKQLLADIDAGKIDVVVVYKVDRLTRSLTDFSKIVETFDAKAVSFISVTQQFNTTTSMGRLTLNVLLSFAQFEREVTGERIRDKVAASKRKGMWMGGTIPLGFTLKERRLWIDPTESKTVRMLFDRYLHLGGVDLLKVELDSKGVKSKARVNKEGKQSGGTPYSRGALYSILRSCTYIGEVSHLGKRYKGEHEGIVPRDVWDNVQATLTAHSHARRNGEGVRNPSLLAGLLVDSSGVRLTPSHTLKNGKRYRYYVTPRATQRLSGISAVPIRIPAHEIEGVIADRIQALLTSPQEIMEAAGLPSDTASDSQALMAAAQYQASRLTKPAPMNRRAFFSLAILRITVQCDGLAIQLSKRGLRLALLEEQANRAATDASEPRPDDIRTIQLGTTLKRCAKEHRLVITDNSVIPTTRAPVSELVTVIALAHQWAERILSGEVTDQRAMAKLLGLEASYVSRVIQCAFLAPDIVEAILAGRHPVGLSAKQLLSVVPMAWSEQRTRLDMQHQF